jgi:hypothetical protein
MDGAVEDGKGRKEGPERKRMPSQTGGGDNRVTI